MEIIILGSGTTIPLAERASPSVAIFIEDQLLLMDMGPGTVRQMSIAGLKHEDIDYIAISHFHPDHTADLIHFIFVTRHPPILHKRKPFTIIGPKGFSQFLMLLKRPYGDWLDLPSGLMRIEELSTVEKNKKEFDGFRILSAPLNHTPHSLGLRIQDRVGNTVVYSGDTGYCDEIIDLAQGADLLILESSFPDGKGIFGHLTPSEAGDIAKRSGVKRLLLTHFYPECLRSNIESQCRKTYQGELILAADLMHIKV
ncbi:MAG: MBL fold metallo-hydrolase [Desulfatiglandales bacterium]